MKITEKEIESCFPSNIKTKIYSDYNIWEIHFQLDYRSFVLYIRSTPSTTTDGVWYTAHLYIRDNHNFELNYGFSDYIDTYDYILKAISLDLESYVKTGKFSNYVKGYHNTLNPEKFEKLKNLENK
jgi:hypothetical protein